MLAYPNYTNCFLNIISSVKAYYSSPILYPTNPQVDNALKARPKNIILGVIDGLSLTGLKQNTDSGSFLRENLVGSMTSVFPSSYVACINSFLSGIAPNEHGYLGSSLFLKEFGSVYSVSDSAVSSPIRNILAYEDIFGGIKNSRQNPRVTVLSDKQLPVSAEFKLCRNTDVAYNEIITLSVGVRDTFTVLYINKTADLTVQTGTTSDEVYNSLSDIDKLFSDLASKLTDTLFIIISLHGFTQNNGQIHLADIPELYNALFMNQTIEPRAASFAVKERHLDEFCSVFSGLLGSEYMLFSKDKLLESKIFGGYRTHRRVDDFLGNVFAAAISGRTFASDSPRQTKAVSGGITENEMILPLIMHSTSRDENFSHGKLI
ncbi:MAG: alkaline phosphatase family protein [Ruminococcus sp.]|jgi:predicted AlkP superfamily pyrophosphatase or phosphodiesterase|nr:alkaline phosphatase family protein [Ruminococcus sp.]